MRQNLKFHTKLDETDYKLDKMWADMVAHREKIAFKFYQISKQIDEQDFKIKNQNEKLELIQVKTEASEQLVKKLEQFVFKNIEDVNQGVASFKMDVEAQINEVSVQNSKIYMALSEEKIRINELFEHNTVQDELLQTRKREGVELSKDFQRFEPVSVRLCDFDAALE